MYEFDLIVDLEDVYHTFLEKWETWKPAVIEFSRASKNTPMQIKQALQDLVPGDSGLFNYWFVLNDTDDVIYFIESESLAALRCLSYFLVTKSNKKKGVLSSKSIVIPHFIMEGVVSRSMYYIIM